MADVFIRPLEDPQEAEHCARIMANSEPWLTLRRDYQRCLTGLLVADREKYVASQDKELLGFLSLSFQGPLAGYIQILCVAPEARGKGVGSSLLNFAEKRIFREHPNVFLCVSSFNVRARALYSRMGYEDAGELKDFVVRGHSEFIMRKTCGPLNEYQPGGPDKHSV